MKYRKLIIVLAYLERYLYLPLIIVLSIVLHFFTPMNALFYLGIGFVVFAAYELISFLCRSKVYYCAYQNAYHLPMTPEQIDWDIVKKSDAYGIPAVFAAFGVAMFIGSFFI